jgi:lysophospholipase L1-like esterase
MTRIFDKLKLNLPDTPVFVMGMTTVLRKYAHMKFGNFLPPQEDLQTVFTVYNNILEELAQNFKLFYVDLPSQWREDVEESWQFYADGIHPSDAGYDLMAETLYDTLRPTVIHPKQKS